MSRMPDAYTLAEAGGGAPFSAPGERPDLGDEVLPMLPDVMGEREDDPHPDGRPWRKACGVCAFRRSDPQGYGVAAQDDLRRDHGDYTFYCLHRHDDGCVRVCASYAALRRGARAADREGRG